LPEDKHYNFYEEFKKIDDSIEKNMYREAGYSCGYMLEYILLGICENFKAKADGDTLEALALGNKSISSFKLGELIGLISKEFSPRKTSSREGKKVLSIICETLKISCNRSLRIDFGSLGDIRINCAHPHKPYPTEKEIRHFKNDLETLADEFRTIFRAEHYLLPPSMITLPENEENTKKPLAPKTKYIDYLDFTPFIIVIILAIIASYMTFIY